MLVEQNIEDLWSTYLGFTRPSSGSMRRILRSQTRIVMQICAVLMVVSCLSVGGWVLHDLHMSQSHHEVILVLPILELMMLLGLGSAAKSAYDKHQQLNWFMPSMDESHQWTDSSITSGPWQEVSTHMVPCMKGDIMVLERLNDKK